MPSELWTPVKTWLEGEKVSADEMVQQVSNNITWLFERNIDIAQVSGVSDYNTTNTNFEAMGALQCIINKSQNESLVRISLSGNGYHSNNAQEIWFDVLVDNNWYLSSGTDTPATNGIIMFQHFGGGYAHDWNFDLLFPDVLSGVHQFNLMWKVDFGTAYLNVTNTIAQFVVEEYGVADVGTV